MLIADKIVVYCPTVDRLYLLGYHKTTGLQNLHIMANDYLEIK